MSANSLLQLTPNGLYCAIGNFYIDPWQPVDRAVITHAHADHARYGCNRYLAAAPGEQVARVRLGLMQRSKRCLMPKPITVTASPSPFILPATS